VAVLGKNNLKGLKSMKKKFRIGSVLLSAILLTSFSVAFVAVAAVPGNAASGQIRVSQAEHRADVLVVDFLLFADDFIERRTAALMGNKKMTPELVSGNGSVYESMRVVDAEKNALTELNARRDVLREWGEAYSHSLTEVTLQRYNIEGGVATLDVEEFTKLYYEKIRGDEPDYTAWVSHRRFVFSKSTTGWELVSQELLNENGPAPKNEPAGVTKDAMRRTLVEIASAQNMDIDRFTSTSNPTSNVTIQSTFNNAAARDYAIRWWNVRNPAYRSFAENCTNFISQAMRAGGWTNVYGWYRDARHWWYNWLNQTWSWVGVRHWHEFAFTHSRRTGLLSWPRSLLEGEVLLVDFQPDGTKDHSMIVTRKTATEIYLTYNTVDHLNRSFASLSLAFPNARWFPHMIFLRF